MFLTFYICKVGLFSPGCTHDSAEMFSSDENQVSIKYHKVVGKVLINMSVVPKRSQDVQILVNHISC